MIKELKSFSPCEIMSCSRQHHKMSPDTPRPQRAAPHCRPLTGKGCPRSSALPEDPAGRTGRAGSGRGGGAGGLGQAGVAGAGSVNTCRCAGTQRERGTSELPEKHAVGEEEHMGSAEQLVP